MTKANAITSNSGLSASGVPKGTNLHSGGGILPDWGKAAHLALELLLPLMALLPLLAGIQRLRPLAKKLRAGYSGCLVLDLRVPKRLPYAY